MSAFDVWVIIVGANVAFSIILAAILGDTRRRRREDHHDLTSHLRTDAAHQKYVDARLDALERAAKPTPEPAPRHFCAHHIIYDGPVQVGTPDYHDFYCAKTAGHDGPHKDQRPGFELEWSETYT